MSDTPGPAVPTARDREAAEVIATSWANDAEGVMPLENLVKLVKIVAQALAAREAEALAWAAGLADAVREEHADCGARRGVGLAAHPCKVCDQLALIRAGRGGPR